MAYTVELLLIDLFLVLIAFIYVGAMIVLPVQLKKRDLISKFAARKMVHLFAGLVVLIVPFFNWPYWAIIIAGTLTAVTYFASADSSVKSLKELYDTIGEEAEENVGYIRKRSYLQGPFHYCMSITVLVSFFVILAPHRMYFAIAGILIMIISDTLASMVGKNYGRVKLTIPYTGSERTLEGSSTFFVSAFGLCYLIFFLYGHLFTISQTNLTFAQIILYSLAIAAIGTIIEMFSPSTWDDLTVPIATTLIIYVLVTFI